MVKLFDWWYAPYEALNIIGKVGNRVQRNKMEQYNHNEGIYSKEQWR